MERLKSMKEAFIGQIQSQLGNLANVDAKELGEVVDMVKDLEEAIYYCTITKAMEAKEHESKGTEHHSHYYTEYRYPEPHYFRDMDKDYGRMYYDGNSRSYSSNNGNSGGNSGSRNYSDGNGQGNSGSRSYGDNIRSYSSWEMDMPKSMMRDEREGKSGRTRRTYMENKSMHVDKAAQLKELEKYIQELGQDLTEMIEGASPEEKQLLQQKVSTLASKIK